MLSEKRVIAERFETAAAASSVTFMKNSGRDLNVIKAELCPAFCNYALAGLLVHVFPVFAVQCPSDNEEYGQKQHHFLADLDACLLERLGSVGQEVNEVIHCPVELGRCHDARRRNLQRVAMTFSVIAVGVNTLR